MNCRNNYPVQNDDKYWYSEKNFMETREKHNGIKVEAVEIATFVVFNAFLN